MSRIVMKLALYLHISVFPKVKLIQTYQPEDYHYTPNDKQY